MSAPARGAPRFEWLVALSSYVLAGALATWPLVCHLGTHSPGSEWWAGRHLYFETPVNLWNLWWVRHALLELGQSPFQCTHLFHPYGADLRLHVLSPIRGAVGVVLQAALSLTPAENVVLLLDLSLAGTFAYLLARRLGVGRPGASLAGALFAFSPAMLAHLYVGHHESMSTFWMPAAVLAFLRLVEADVPRARDAVLLGTLLLGATLTFPYYGLFTAELVAIAAAVHWRRCLRPATLAALAGAGLVAGAGAAPLWQALATSAPAVDAGHYDVFAADLLGFGIPSFMNPLFAPLLVPLHLRLYPQPHETTVFLGWSVLALALAGWRRRWRDGQPVALPVVIALVFLTLSLGSHLKVAGTNTGVTLPGGFLAELPVFGFARAPGRHVLPAMLAVGLLAGAGWEALGRPLLRVLALAAVALEYAAVPVPLFATAPSPAHRRLADVPGDFAILDVPFGLRDGRAIAGDPHAAQIIGQTVHERPMVGGIVARLPDATWAAIHSAPLIGTLLAPEGPTAAMRERDRREAPAYFARWRIAAVVVHPAARGGEAQRYVEEVLPIRAREAFDDGAELLWVGEPPG